MMDYFWVGGVWDDVCVKAKDLHKTLLLVKYGKF